MTTAGLDSGVKRASNRKFASDRKERLIETVGLDSAQIYQRRHEAVALARCYRNGSLVIRSPREVTNAMVHAKKRREALPTDQSLLISRLLNQSFRIELFPDFDIPIRYCRSDSGDNNEPSVSSDIAWHNSACRHTSHT